MTGYSRESQRTYDNASAYDEDAESLEEYLQDRTSEKLQDIEWMTKNIQIADDERAGNMCCEHYDELERAMADLHMVDPADLLNSDVLARLYRLAKDQGEDRAAKLKELAREEAESDLKELGEASND